MEVPVFLSNKSQIWDFYQKTKNCLVIVLLLGKFIEGIFLSCLPLILPCNTSYKCWEQSNIFLVPELQFALPKLFSNVCFPVVEMDCPTASITKEYFELNKNFVRLFVLWFCGRWSFGREKLQKSQMLTMKQSTSSREMKREFILLFNPISLISKWAAVGNLAFL